MTAVSSHHISPRQCLPDNTQQYGVQVVFWFDNSVTYHRSNSRSRSTPSGTDLRRNSTETICLHDASTSPDREAAEAHALWPSGQVRSLCTES